MTDENTTGLETVKAKLLRNTVVFIDTSFFKNYTPKKAEYGALFQYCRDGLVTLCTSHIVVEEWRTQKVSHAHKTLQDLAEKMAYLFSVNIFAQKVLGDVKPYIGFPDETSISRTSKEVVEDFLRTNDIRNLAITENHMQSAWDGYFHGNPPYDRPKNKEHIPDSWIYEAAKEAIADPKNQTLQNRFCICEDKNLRDSLQGLGWTPITLVELLAQIQAEIQTLPAESAPTASPEQADVPIVAVGQQSPEIQAAPSEAAAVAPTEQSVTSPVAVGQRPREAAAFVVVQQSDALEGQSSVAEQIEASASPEGQADRRSLETLFTSLITDEMKNICVWVLGSIHWHKGPTKDTLNATLSTQGFDQKLVDATIIVLAQKTLNLIQDTGNHYIPIDRAICKQAASFIEADFIKIMGLG